MGLGKTIQILAHILSLKNRSKLTEPALVVCPKTLLSNWQEEAARFAPGLRVLCVQGNAGTRNEQLAEWSQYDLIITSYPQALRDEGALDEITFGLMVLDEAQQVKNAEAKTATLLRGLRANRVLLVTGTPLENHLGEFWTIFDYALPGALGDTDMFRRQFRNPIERHGDLRLQAILAAMTAPFILRRTKEQVMPDLPKKTEKIIRVEFSAAKRKLYEQLRTALYVNIQSTIAIRGLQKSSIAILAALLKLRQACDDPRLVKLDSAKTVHGSAKLEALEEILEDALSNGRKVLVFSSFTQMLDLIEPSLRKLGIGYVRLDGQTRDRRTPVQRFQNGEVPVFLISLKAGGVGLNLTAADTVIHFDPWWNPAAENQATDRAHRIGQDKPVMVYKLICSNTLEEHVLNMQARKAALAHAILDGGATATTVFTQSDVEAMFR